MASETAYAPLAQEEQRVEFEPESKPQPQPQQQAVHGAHGAPVFWVPVARRGKWRGNCIQCCGSSQNDCKACCFATCFPCLAFGHNMRRGLLLGFAAQAVLFFVYMSFFHTISNVGAAVQCGVPADGFMARPAGPWIHRAGPNGHHEMRGMHGSMTVPDRADGEVDRWMMNMHHNHPMHRRQLSEPAAATATATATATSNDGSVMFLPVSPDAVVAQLNTFFSQIAQANEEFARVARGVETVATAAAAEQGSAFPSEVLVRQPQVTSEAVVASQLDEFPEQEAVFTLFIDDHSAPLDYDESSSSTSDAYYADSASSSSTSSDVVLSEAAAAQLRAQRAEFRAWDSCMCKWRMLDMATRPLMLVFLVYAGFRRTQLRRRLGIPGSLCEDQLMWLCCSSFALCQETRTVAHHFSSGCLHGGPACANPAVSAFACEAPVAPQMMAVVAQPIGGGQQQQQQQAAEAV